MDTYGKITKNVVLQWGELPTSVGEYIRTKSLGMRSYQMRWFDGIVWGCCICVYIYIYTVKCRYNAVQFIMILHTGLWKQRQKVNQILESQQTSHISPSRASYGVSLVKIVDKIDHVITAPHCIWILWALFYHHWEIWWSTFLPNSASQSQFQFWTAVYGLHFMNAQ